MLVILGTSCWLAELPVRYPVGLMRSANDTMNRVCAAEGAKKRGGSTRRVAGGG